MRTKGNFWRASGKRVLSLIHYGSVPFITLAYRDKMRYLDKDEPDQDNITQATKAKWLWKSGSLKPLLSHDVSVSLGCSNRILREGNGDPLQYSCLENPMDAGAWWAAVHGVAKSRKRLSDFTFTFHFHALEKKVATHSSVLAWRIPGTGEPDGLPSLGSHRVGHNWSHLAAAAAATEY